MKNPLISFVIPTYNSVAWLAPAIESCLKQTYSPVQVVVIDDASTDTTPMYFDHLRSLGDQRIKLFRYASNVGRCAARNKGNDLADGEIICVLDADDMAYPKRAEMTVSEFKKGSKFLYGSAMRMTALGDKLGEVMADTFDREKSLKTFFNYIVHSSVAYTKELSKEFPYSDDPEISRLGIDDWAQQISIALAGVKLDFIPNILTAYRVLSTSISKTRNEDEVKTAKNKILDSLLKLA